MITIGMLSHRKDPRTVFKSYAYAAAAKMEGVDFYFFSPGSVNFNDRRILAWVYEDGQWMQKSRPFPDVIYNSSSPGTERQEEIVDRLHEMIPFTSYSIGDKMHVHKKIKEGKLFAHYLIPSTEILKYQDVFKFLHRHKKIVLKPLYGHKGQNIFFVWRNKENFIVQQDKTRVKMNKTKFKVFAEKVAKKESYLAQAFIKSTTKKGLATHFRLHVQKNEEGKWALTTIYPCIASEGFTANLSNGGYTTMFEIFLKKEFGGEYYNIKRYMEHFAVVFSEHFDRLYDGSLDELGIDIGLDSIHRIWIYEVNWRPGTPATFALELDVVKRMIRYARFLAEKNCATG
ncbi:MULTISPECIES: YheC/YheD family protein [unclassified Bacillus (in: firmicutes)]|uniref:YheC/YheD family endospore coat-associated protein n=1 Tax=unclassified Bacillus (in: firmicutes) TaxID=185979 RepID=UPI001BE6CFE2|nr:MULTISPECIES: YheC/YheD family protein [unclassified Bacillus (in: firmicutes)]MBT2720740.1 YheC/YheD family protein [Bacillus sp. ISL-46]MBT2740985.1 YheC/YheD family protein [Bacillus sp. ISL-77]